MTTKVYDKDGHLVSVANAGPGSNVFGTTTYQYDTDGRLAKNDRPYLESSSTSFTKARPARSTSAETEPAPRPTEYIYYNANELVKTVHYADYLSAATRETPHHSSSVLPLVAALR